MKKIKEFFSDESGVISAAYGLVVAVIATVVLAILAFLGTNPVASGSLTAD